MVTIMALMYNPLKGTYCWVSQEEWEANEQSTFDLAVAVDDAGQSKQ